MKRLPVYDYAKGIGIIFVILGHMTTYPHVFREMIYSFHMPLFFIISGILIGQNGLGKTPNWGGYLLKKCRQILLPALFFELIMYGWWIIKTIIEGDNDVSYLRRFLGVFLQIGYSDYRGDLWFLPSFFLACIVLYPLWRFNKKFLAIAAILMMVASYTFTYFYPQLYLPWHFEIVPVCCSYVLIGSLLSFESYRIYLCIFIFVVLFFLNHRLGYVYSLDSHTFGNIILDTVLAVSGSLVVIITCGSIRLFSEKSKVLQALSFIGKNSLAFYGIHEVFVGCLNSIIRIFFKEADLSSYVGVLISIPSLCLSLVLSTICVYLYNNSIRPILIGQMKRKS